MASGHDLSEEIQEDILSCPICYHQLTEPKALPCQHTYCCKCLQELARRAKNGQFQCPECGKTVAIPTGGVEAFPTNFLVANVLDKVQQCREEKKKQADETDMCDIHKQEAQVVCDDCNVVVCNVCLKSGHKGHVLKHIDQEKAIWVEKARRLIVESGEVSAGLSHQESHTLVKQRLQEKHEEIRKQIESRAAAVIHTVQRQKKNLLEELQQRQERKHEKISQRETQCNRLIDMMLEGRTRAEEAINNNRPLLYNDISSHCLGLASAVSEGIAYRAKYSPLQEEVCGLRFVTSSVELGHFVEGNVEVSPYHGMQGSSSNTDQQCLNGAKIHGNKSEKNPGKKVTFASHPIIAATPSGRNERENSTLIILDDDDDALNSNRTPTDHQKPASRKRKPWPKSPLSDLALTQLVKASCSRDSDPPVIPESSANTTTNSNGDNSVQKVPHRLTSLVTELRGRLDTKTGNSNGDNTAQMAAEGLASELPERRGTKAATGDSIGDRTVQKVAQAKRAARKLLETQGTKNTARKTVRSVNSTSWRPERYMKPQVEIMRMKTEGNVATASASRANGASASTSASASISAPTYASASTSSPASSSASTSSPASSSASTSSPASTSAFTRASTSASSYARTPASASTFASTSTSAAMSTPASASTSACASTSSSVAAHPGASRTGPYSSTKDKNGKRPVKKLRLSCSDKEHWFVKTKVELTSDDDDDN